ncbi:MAG: ADP-ribosylglycohydrolase family protein [Bryobacteraceae bacterium]
MRLVAERVRSCIIGGAWGDVSGGLWERQRMRMPASELSLSDDTQLTLATCEAIMDAKRVDPASIADAMLRWFREGRVTGMGSSTLKALRDLDAGVHWAFSGAAGEYAAGNGAAMRIAPLAFLLDPRDTAHRTVIHDVCRITHRNDEAFAGALAVVAAIEAAISRGGVEWNLFETVAEILPDTSVRDRMTEIVGRGLSPREIAGEYGAGGHVVETVPLALACAISSGNSTLRAVELAAEISEDSDTVASIAGQIAGAAEGPWLDNTVLRAIRGGSEVFEVAERFAGFVHSRPRFPL